MPTVNKHNDKKKDSIIGEKTKTKWALSRTGLPFIVQWCRNVRDAECPPDTQLCSAPGGGSPVSTLAAITARSSARKPGRQQEEEEEEEEEGEEAHPQRDLLETWPPSGGYRRVLRSDESTNLLRLALFSKGRTRGRGRRCRKDPSRHHHHHHHHQPLRWLRRGHRRLPR